MSKYASPVHRPAAPVGSTYSDSLVIDDGMTLRDYFAAKAMQSLILEMRHDPATFEKAARLKVAAYAVVAECAYMLADAMLEARGA